jgi:pyridoxal phosphate enzyme (YggS family)
MSRVTGPDISWHYIGRLQSNKTRAVARNFDWVHTVDRLRLAARLNDQRPDLRPPLNVLIQVNLAGEIGKGGLAPERMFRLATEIQSMPRLKLRGLMGIPQAGLSHEQTIVAARRDTDVFILGWVKVARMGIEFFEHAANRALDQLFVIDIVDVLGPNAPHYID